MKKCFNKCTVVYLKAIMIHSICRCGWREGAQWTYKTTAFKNRKDCLNSEHNPPSKLGQQPPSNKICFTGYMTFRDIRSKKKLIENKTSKKCGITAYCLCLPGYFYRYLGLRKNSLPHPPLTPLHVISFLLCCELKVSSFIHLFSWEPESSSGPFSSTFSHI